MTFVLLTALAAAAPAAGGLLGGAFSSVSSAFGFGSKAPPPNVDTKSANQAFARPDQLTPVSASTGSQTISPKTPTGRSSRGGDDYFPAIAGSNSPSQTGRPGGYGGFGEETEPAYGYSTSPNKLPEPTSLLQRKMEGLKTSEADLKRSASTAAPPNAASAPPRPPRKNGYGGFGAPQGELGAEFAPRPANQRAGTFPRENAPKGMDELEAPARAPSSSSLHPDRIRRPSYDPGRSSTGNQRPIRDTSRPPPPRTSLVRPQTANREGSRSINLADEFGVGNPYHQPQPAGVHSPSISQSSSNSGYSHASRPSLPSSQTSPARSTNSRRQPSGTQKIDDLMKDLETSIDSFGPGNASPAASPPLQPPPRPTREDRSSAPRNRQPPPEGRYRSQQSPPSEDRPSAPYMRQPPPDHLGLGPRDDRAPGPRPSSPLASPRSPRLENPYSNSRMPPAPAQESGSRSPVAGPNNLHARQQSQGRSRGNCKACQLPITGKSVSSADGRLTGKYHKACFVCTTCVEPFASSTFYVLNDQPYCERHYHKLNGSLCGMCKHGIEGQYLEDESTQKYHPRCFRCGDCGLVLQDGYFDVGGRAYCERDAMRRLQPPMRMGPPPGRGGPGLRPPMNGGRPPYGMPPPGNGQLGPPGGRPRMQKRMTRLGMMM